MRHVTALTGLSHDSPVNGERVVSALAQQAHVPGGLIFS